MRYFYERILIVICIIKKPAIMTKAKLLIIITAMCPFFCAKPTYREMAQPTVNEFCRLYSTANYDSIITLLHSGRQVTPADPAERQRLVVMLRMFREKLGAVKGGSITDVRFVPGSEKDSTTKVIFDADFTAGPGRITFDFRYAKHGLKLQQFEFGSSLLGPDFMQRYRRELSKQIQVDSVTSATAEGARP
jgi:hypothetical protein